MHPFEGIVVTRPVRASRRSWKRALFFLLSIALVVLRSKSAVAEEATTLAVGEEGGGPPKHDVVTTQAVGEEGGGTRPPVPVVDNQKKLFDIISACVAGLQRK